MWSFFTLSVKILYRFCDESVKTLPAFRCVRNSDAASGKQIPDVHQSSIDTQFLSV